MAGRKYNGKSVEIRRLTAAKTARACPLALHAMERDALSVPTHP